MKYPAALIVPALLLSSISFAAPDGESEKPDSVVVQMLEEIVKIHERIAESAKLELELGKGDALNKAFVDLSEAKLALAIETGDQAGIISELEAIVSFRKSVLKREQLLAEENRRTQDQLGQLRVDLLQAEIRLLRAKPKHAIK